MSTVVTDNVQDSGGSSLLGRRNAIINGNFGVNQRGVSGTVSLSAGEYGHDRWKAGASGATYTFSNSGGVTTIDISAGSLIQVVEDVNVVTDTYVLSFEGTAQGKIGGGSFGDSGVTGAVTGGSNLNIKFGTGTVSKVQLEVGNKPTPFEHRSIGEELALCQRYYYKIGPQNDDIPFGLCFVKQSDIARPFIHFPTQMRVAPTAVESTGVPSDYRVFYSSDLDIVASGTPTIDITSPVSFLGGLSFPGSPFDVRDTPYLRSATSDAFLAWSAEL